MVRPPPSATAAEYKVSGEVYLEDGFGQGHHTHDGSFFCLFCPISLKTWVVSTALPPEREGAAETYGGSGGEEARGKYSYGLR